MLRLLNEDLPSGDRLTIEELNKMIKDYYHARNWTDDGLISDSKIEDLGLTGMLFESS